MRPSGNTVRAGAVASSLGLLGSLGCSELMGFEHSEGVQCVHNSDCTAGLVCLTNLCTVECNHDVDCSVGQTCQDTRCRATAEVSAEASVSCPAGCKDLDTCQDGVCRPGQKQPPYAGADAAIRVTTSMVIPCIQISISTCGWLTGLGIVLASGTNAEFRFAVYDDLGGNPNDALSASDEVLIQGLGKDVPVSPVVSVGCGPETTPYWVCFASSAQQVALAAVPNTEVNWQVAPAPGFIGLYVDGGLPDHWSPTLETTKDIQPLVYPWIAQ